MAIRQLKDGRWIVYYRNPENPLKKRKEYFGRGPAAKAEAHRRNRELGFGLTRKGPPQKKQSPLFQELSKAYVTAKSQKKNTPSTLQNLEWKLFGVILPEIGDTPAIRLTHYRMDQYVAKRAKSPVMRRTGPKKKPEFKPVINADGTVRYTSTATICRELDDIRAILNWAVRENLLSMNPIANYERPAYHHAIIRPPSMEEINAIIEHAPEHLIRAINLAFYTGLRPGVAELFGITYDDIDFSGGSILIRSALKGGPASRTIPLSPEFIDQLCEWQNTDRAAKIKYKNIITWRGKPVRSIKRAFITAKKKAGITRRLRLYDIRHTFASILADATGDIKTISELLGHSRPDTTARVYRHTNLANQRMLMNHLPSLGAQKQPPGDTPVPPEITPGNPRK